MHLTIIETKELFICIKPNNLNEFDLSVEKFDGKSWESFKLGHTYGKSLKDYEDVDADEDGARVYVNTGAIDTDQNIAEEHLEIIEAIFAGFDAMPENAKTDLYDIFGDDLKMYEKEANEFLSFLESLDEPAPGDTWF